MRLSPKSPIGKTAACNLCKNMHSCYSGESLFETEVCCGTDLQHPTTDGHFETGDRYHIKVLKLNDIQRYSLTCSDERPFQYGTEVLRYTTVVLRKEISGSCGWCTRSTPLFCIGPTGSGPLWHLHSIASDITLNMRHEN